MLSCSVPLSTKKYLLPSGLQIEDILIGPAVGESVEAGKIIGFQARVIIGDKASF